MGDDMNLDSKRSTPISTWVFARALLRTTIRASSADRATFVTQALFMLFNNGIFFLVWWVLFRRVPHLRGWRLADVELLFGIVAAAYGLVAVFAGGVMFLGRCIQSGQLDTILVQPKPTLLYAVGLRSRASGIGDLVAGFVLIALSGYTTWSALPFLVVAIAGSAAILFASGIVFFSLPFWLSRSESVSMQLWELVVTFSLYPEPLFGGALRLLLFTAIPAGFVGYLPVELVRRPSIGAVLVLLSVSIVYLWAAAWIFRRGLRRYTSGSRFVVFG
jgi:ABC-2 type transport system permease protein